MEWRIGVAMEFPPGTLLMVGKNSVFVFNQNQAQRIRYNGQSFCDSKKKRNMATGEHNWRECGTKTPAIEILESLIILRQYASNSTLHLCCAIVNCAQQRISKKNGIGGHKFVNPLITKLTFSLTR